MRNKPNNPYVVLIAGMLTQLCAGIIYMWSIFKQPVALHLEWAQDKAALTSSIMLASFVAGLILGGRAQDKFGPKRVVLFGSIFISIGMVLTAFVPKSYPELIYLTYGIIGGLGVGAVYTTTVAVVQKWFPNKRGFATGMMVSAFGFSLVLFAPLTKALLANYGVPFTFTAIGIAFLLICAPCSFLIVNPKNFESDSTSAKIDDGSYTTKQMLKTPQFYMMAFAMFTTLPAYFIMNPIFVTFGLERGLTDNLTVLGVMITGIASAVGRLGFSWLSDIIGRKAAIISFIAINLLGTVGLIYAKGYMYIICIGVISLAFGGSAGVYPALTADYYGTRNMGLNYGCVMLGFGVSSLVFPLISNAITVNNNYVPSLIMAALTCVASIVLILLLKQPKRLHASSDNLN